MQDIGSFILLQQDNQFKKSDIRDYVDAYILVRYWSKLAHTLTKSKEHDLIAS